MSLALAQDDAAPKKDDSFEAELCKDRDAGEWFRLVSGEGDNCRDVIQCTSSVSWNYSFILSFIEQLVHYKFHLLTCSIGYID